MQGIDLAHFLHWHQEELALPGRTVLELGAGTGLVSITACLMGQHPLIIMWLILLSHPHNLNLIGIIILSSRLMGFLVQSFK